MLEDGVFAQIRFNSRFYALVDLRARNDKNPATFIMLQQKEVKKDSNNRSSFSKNSSTCF